MGLFNDILENAKAVMVDFGEKANDVYDVTKLNALKCRIKSDIDKAQKALGETYYTLAKESKLDTADLSEQINAIDELYVQFDAVTKQIDDIKKLKRCKVCGNTQAHDKPFCADCGAKL